MQRRTAAAAEATGPGPETDPEIDFCELFAAAPTPYAVLTRDLVIREANRAYLRVTSRERDELVGRHVFEAFPQSPDDAEGEGVRNLRASLERVRDTGRADSMALQRYDITTPAGVYVERYWSPINVPVVDEAGATRLILHRVEDVTDYVRERQRQEVERAEGEDWRRRGLAAEADLFARAAELQAVNRELRDARDQLAARSLHDPLTGLLVRSVFREELTRALSRLTRHPHPLAVLFVDLDRLKQVNDTHGHGAGDELIRCCADRLRASVRPSDPVARIGGDEFVVLLDDLHDAREAEVVAERVLAALRSPCLHGSGLSTPVSASIGVAVVDTPGPGADALIASADAAMYRAKQTGRGRVEVFDEALSAASAARRRLTTELLAALPAGQLRLHYQPIVDLSTGATSAVEALLRWQHPDRGLLSAGEFIEVAEDHGLVPDLGAWVLEQGCAQLAAWDAALGDRAPARLFLNLSATELAAPDLDRSVAGAARAAGIAPGRLVLEITETGVPDDLHVVGDTAAALLRRGCEVAIDDFGTGHSSLTRLVQLPAGIVKIDRSFVRDLHRDPAAAAVVSAVLLLAHNLRKTVVAEGVEDADSLAALVELGCPLAQGFHLARPQPANELTRLLAGVEQRRADPGGGGGAPRDGWRRRTGIEPA